jgi:hypothetical protein
MTLQIAQLKTNESALAGREAQSEAQPVAGQAGNDLLWGGGASEKSRPLNRAQDQVPFSGIRLKPLISFQLPAISNFEFSQAK